MANIKTNANIPNKEVYSRMNFLYQASMLIANCNSTLGSYYGQQCRQIGQKALLKIAPDLKRDLCKRCSLAQQPGISTDLEIEEKTKRRNQKRGRKTEVINIDSDDSVLMKCRKCGYIRRLKVNPNFEFWLENKDSIKEEITYSNEDQNPKKN